MRRLVSIGSILLLIVSFVGVNAAGVFKSSRANDAMERYANSVQQAAEEFDKRARGARATCIRELESAESAASRVGDSSDAQKIHVYLTNLTQMQEAPSELPRPILPPSAALANTQFKVSSGKTWHFMENGIVFTALNGKKVAEGHWKQLGSHSVTAQFRVLYAIAFDPGYEQCVIRGESGEYHGKRIE